MASTPHRSKPLRATATATEPPAKSALPARWKMLAIAFAVATAFLLGYKLTPTASTAAPPHSALTSSAPSAIPELAELPPPLHQAQEIQMVGDAGHWVPMGKLKEGDTVWRNGRWLVVKSIKHETVTQTKEVEVPVKPPVPKPCEETSLELDLSQGGDTFEETLIVPADKIAALTTGTAKQARDLEVGDRIHMSGERIALIKQVETKWYTPPTPQEPDENGNVTSRVIGTVKRMTDRILYLHTDKETIGTTPEHPFSIEGKGWVQAGRLQQGDRIKTQDGQIVTVECLEVKAERKMVYNLKVEGTETYFVGKNKMLVHNGGDCVPSPLNPFKGKTVQEIDEMLRAKGYSPRGPDPVNGLGGYVNPRTGRSLHIDSANSFGEPPHVDVNRLRSYNGPLPKRKYPFGLGGE